MAEKAKTSKWGRRIAISVLTVLVLMVNVPLRTAYAEVDCPPGWDAEGENCTKAGQNIECPDNTFEKVLPPVNGKTTCKKTIVLPPGLRADEDLLKSLQFLVILQQALNKLLWPVLVIIGGLMDNTLLFGSGMEERLRDIWILIRNLVNILFVIVLVGIALYNVLGLGEEGSEYSIKKTLPKIIIGIIVINFSFLGIKIFLDAINVLTVSVFSLPGQVSEGLDDVIKEASGEEEKLFIKKLCATINSKTLQELNNTSDEVFQQQIKLRIWHTAARSVPGVTNNDSLETLMAKINELGGDQKEPIMREAEAQEKIQLCFNKKDELTLQGKQFLSRYNSRNAAFAMALNMGKIVFYQDLDFSATNTERLFVNTLFSMLLYIIYAASFIALFIVLLARLVVMWLSIAIAPVLILILFSPGIKEKAGGFGKIAGQFVKMAIAPLIIALAMTVGWIMLKALQGLDPAGFNTAFSIDPSQGIPVVGLNTLQDFVVAIGTIAVVWLGVFSAAEGTIAQGATDMMKSVLTDAGKWVGSIPLRYIPAVPLKVPGPGGQMKPYTATIAELTTAASDAFGRKESRGLSDLLGLTGRANPKDILKAKTEEDVASHIRNRGSDFGDADDYKHFRTLSVGTPEQRKVFIDADRKMNGLLGKLVKSTETNRAGIAKDIREDPSVRNAPPVVAVPPPAVPPEATPAAEAAAKKPLTKEPTRTILPGDSLGKKVRDERNIPGESENEITEALKPFNEAGTKLAKAIDEKNPTKENLKALLSEPALKAVTTVGGKVVETTIEDLSLKLDGPESTLNGPRYTKMLETLGGGAGRKEEGEKVLEGLGYGPEPAPSAP